MSENKQYKNTIHVFTDGACTGNGKKHAKCGYGVYFPDKESSNISRKFRYDPQTNQRAELYAIFKALKRITKSYDFEDVIIYTDSMYSINCVTKWIKSWKKEAVNDKWLSSKGEDVLNQDIIRKIDKILSDEKYQHKIHFIHVASHQTTTDTMTAIEKFQTQGNIMADALATNGLKFWN